jgi:nucleoid-associated protein YgaU
MTITNSARIRALSIISITVVFVLLLLASASYATGEVTETFDYRIRPGDTLWDIAHEHGPEGRDVRAVVATIERINGLDGAAIQAGQVIEIPVVTSG